MARKRSQVSKLPPTTIPRDLYDRLDLVACMLDVSIADLLQWGAALVCDICGEELPESIAHLRQAPYGPEHARSFGSEHVVVSLDDRAYVVLRQLAKARGRHPKTVIHDLVRGNLRLAMN